MIDGQVALSEGELVGIQPGKVLSRSANMPSRPMNTTEHLNQEAAGEIIKTDSSTSESKFYLDFSADQLPDDRKAEGHFHLRNEDSGFDFQSEALGRVQVTDGWTSFTGRGTINDKKEKTFQFIIDKENPLAEDKRPTVIIQIEGMDEIKGFLDETDMDDSSIEQMKTLVDQFRATGEIENAPDARLFKTHLTAIGHYEKSNAMERAIKHMNAFKQLLAMKKEADLISENAYTSLMMHADHLIKDWQ